MMNNLVGTAVALDHCRFYVENMVNLQFEQPLASIPPEPPYNEPINSRVLHSLIDGIQTAFDNAISRTDLQFPYAPILYRFRSIYGVYCNQYLDEATIKRAKSERPAGFPASQSVPVRVENEHDKEFAVRFLRHTADQVSAFLYMVSIDQYAREQTDCWLPAPPDAFDLPKAILLVGNGVAYTSVHNELVNHLMEAMLKTYSDTLDIHVSLRDYGVSVLFPLVAECRNVLYAAWPIPSRQPQFKDSGEHVTFDDLPVDDDEEEFEPIPPMGPTFENQAEWVTTATEIAQSFNLQAFADDGDSSFVLKPVLYKSGDDFLFWSEEQITGKVILDIAISPIIGQAYEDMDVKLRSVGKTLREYAEKHSCHIISRYIEQEDQIIGALFRVRRNIDFPNSPLEVTTHVEIAL
ncbi:hypothetical protein MPK66_gp238 [Erwinia phage pEa_SNUABM_2]|uniref:Uncharacterized protein n=1 Tax=Erwinia phage pEa_SNUABM_2 TaxID=2869547 RepID=A0AAE7XNG4_9CAUD|nr:hypothetical protein MPK66_gp238 [Erwinia phage pEa_SNUABM_2]QZE59482.1 hypothetical protein pEaSNUABM2_00238 [Erwinia phage pEa_SNUABM_2]